MSVQHLRFAFSWHIRQDPVTLTVTREQKQRAGGGWVNLAPTTVGPFRGRVAAGRELPREFVDQHAGELRIERGYVLLCQHTTELRGRDQVYGNVTNVQDWFVHPTLGRFQVVAVTPSLYGTVVCGYVCDLEGVIR